MVKRIGLLVACFGFFSLPTLRALTVSEMDFETLLDNAEEIYMAQVVAVSCDWSGDGANRHIATFVRLRVLESYRGAVRGEQTLEFFGGEIAGRRQRIVGLPEFQPGDIEVLFVRDNHRTLSPIVGVFHGRFRVVKNAADGREQVYLHDRTPLTDLALVGKAAPGRLKVPMIDGLGAPTRPLTTATFVAKIRSGLIARGLTPDPP